MFKCVCSPWTSLHPYVRTCIYYITAPHACGSEAADQHHDGDSIKTRGGFKLEEGYLDREREKQGQGGR